MSLYRIAVTHQIHRCPNFPGGHPWSTSRRVVEVIDGGPCMAPVTVHLAGAVVELPCPARMRNAERCPNCANSIEIVEEVSLWAPGN